MATSATHPPGPSRSQYANLKLPPLCASLESFVLYETRSHFYLVGADRQEDQFKFIKIDRTDPRELIIEEDAATYSIEEIQQILAMVADGNRTSGGLSRCLTAYGIVGFVRFLQGFYMILIVKRSVVGRFGPHIVYSVSSTAFIPIPHPSVYQPPPNVESNLFKRIFSKSPEERFYNRVKNDEARYRNIFNIVDLTRHFYFSYTLDLTRTLQYLFVNADEPPKPKSMYVWNDFLQKPFRRQTHDRRWTVNLIHGFFLQRHCSTYGRRITLTLIARRSRHFAGTRYRKRGLNDKGQVANDVETEQVVSEGGRYTSYVQLRASIPLFWTQESSAMVPKPAIVVQKVDPMHLTTRLHFQDLFSRYGSPILAVNLVKQKEKNPRESLIGGSFGEAVDFINKFLPEEHQIDYVAWDFKKVSKSKLASVVDKLGIISRWALRRTGLFNSHPSVRAVQVTAKSTMEIKPHHLHSLAPNLTKRNEDEEVLHPWADEDVGVRQCGVMRSNCIDSLDRTNVSQFCIGREALSRQLYALNMITSIHSEVIGSSKIIKVLLDMYEAMGDAIAIQYGGSQMHRKLKSDAAPSQSAPALQKRKKPGKGREMFVSFMRHYRNIFQDHDKQDAFNLFLGLFQPALPRLNRYPINIWDLSSDFFLHNSTVGSSSKRKADLGALAYDSLDWYRVPISYFLRSNGLRLSQRPGFTSLVRSLTPVGIDDIGHVQMTGAPNTDVEYLDEHDDAFDRVYDIHELTYFDELLDRGSLEFAEELELVISKHPHAKRARRALGWLPQSPNPPSSPPLPPPPPQPTSDSDVDSHSSTDEEEMDVPQSDDGSTDTVRTPQYKSINNWFHSDAAGRERLLWEQGHEQMSPGAFSDSVYSPFSGGRLFQDCLPTQPSTRWYDGHVPGSNNTPQNSNRISYQMLRGMSHLNDVGGGASFDGEDECADATAPSPTSSRQVYIVVGNFPSVSGGVPVYCFGRVKLPKVFPLSKSSAMLSPISNRLPRDDNDRQYLHSFHPFAFSNELACEQYGGGGLGVEKTASTVKQYVNGWKKLRVCEERSLHTPPNEVRSRQGTLTVSMSMPLVTRRRSLNGRAKGHIHTHSMTERTTSILNWVSPRKLFGKFKSNVLESAIDEEEPLNMHMLAVGVDHAQESYAQRDKRAALRHGRGIDEVDNDWTNVSTGTFEEVVTQQWNDHGDRALMDIYTRYVTAPGYHGSITAIHDDSNCLDVSVKFCEPDINETWVPQGHQDEFFETIGDDDDDGGYDDGGSVTALKHQLPHESGVWSHNIFVDAVGDEHFKQSMREASDRTAMRLQRATDLRKFAHVGLSEHEWAYDVRHDHDEDDDMLSHGTRSSVDSEYVPPTSIDAVASLPMTVQLDDGSQDVWRSYLRFNTTLSL